jgi:NADH:ubiquinone oxidoreductase subunit
MVWEKNIGSAYWRHGRIMPDAGHETRERYIFVKSKDSSDIDPEFELTMKYTINHDPTESTVGVHKGKHSRAEKQSSKGTTETHAWESSG